MVFVCIFLSHTRLSRNPMYSLGAEHIGIITPYFAQRCKIKSLLDRNPKLQDSTVGSVEMFQGQVDVVPRVLDPCD